MFWCLRKIARAHNAINSRTTCCRMPPTRFACDPNFGLNLRCHDACKDLFVYALLDARLEHVGLIGVTLEAVPQLVCKHRIPSSRRHCTPPHIHFVTIGARRDDLAKRPQQIFKSISGARGALGSQNYQYCTENPGYPNRTLSNFEVNDSLLTPPPAPWILPSSKLGSRHWPLGGQEGWTQSFSEIG